MTNNRPQLARFDQGAVTPLKMLRSMPAELRGVVTNLHEALKEIRSCVFRAGTLVLTDEQVALQAWLDGATLKRTLPIIIQAGFMARDDAGALFSPHLYDRLLRKEERAARKAQAEADRAQWVAEAQDRGDAPQGMTPKQIASIINGRKGGRPRKNPAPAVGQKNMPFYGVVGGTEKPEQKNNTSWVMENELTGSVGSLEEERIYTNLNNTLSSSSNSREPEIPKPDTAEVSHIAQKAREAGGIGADQRTYAENYVRDWLRAGADEALIVRTIAPLHGKAHKFVYFDAPVRQAIQQKATEPAAKPAIPKDEAEQQAQAVWKRAQPLWARMMQETRDLSAVDRKWPSVAQEHDLPNCPPRYDAYVAYFRQQANGTRAAA
ncbi:hypothetical protein ACI01nite_25280 [Acetobacter cibinongensis]|uniref:Uncharacterized protein n=1 Tax=Acetobacter cibinongensis TaxID=146475 RepID=A0A0D6N6I5_9PROT|nr:hypothetical protein [Acetobacter cibinongensis]GAN61579.1 hypothetical protein Abci_046_012 [Acetobacter cibinongensis]GBQ17686.1 hypothetical protein AA0482_1984 [Acetobacter cibinongensis NRIC 0482]GEL59926.1 hypothetical protein ACI01nite_25280 [Acetobacter cibinongensis]